MRFADTQWVHLFWLAGAVVGALGWLELRHRDRLSRFLSAVMQRRLVEAPTRGARLAKLLFIAAALAFGVLALMRPQTRGGLQTVGSARVSGDIMIVLDTSRSMLADDAAPSRLERAKAEISSLVAELDHHRVGLLVFAGRASLLCPPTTDDAFFRTVLRDVDTKAVGRGGTKIGVALRAAVEALGPGDGAKLIVLITDGEDHDSFPEDAAKTARDVGIRVVTIGYGSEQGSQISVTNPDTGARTLVTDASGQPVVSRLDGALLRSIAETTQGAYVPAGTGVLDLESIVTKHIEPLVRASDVAATRVVPGEQYPWFALGALVCVVLAAWMSAQTQRGRSL
jgi:Ca-activated chloride channel family protein